MHGVMQYAGYHDTLFQQALHACCFAVCKFPLKTYISSHCMHDVMHYAGYHQILYQQPLFAQCHAVCRLTIIANFSSDCKHVSKQYAGYHYILFQQALHACILVLQANLRPHKHTLLVSMLLFWVIAVFYSHNIYNIFLSCNDRAENIQSFLFINTQYLLTNYWLSHYPKSSFLNGLLCCHGIKAPLGLTL